VVNVEVTQHECGEGGRRKYNIRGNRAGIVETTLRAVAVDDHKTSRGGVKETVRGEEVQSHNITRSEKGGQEGNSSQKRTINVKGNSGLAATIGEGGKNSKQIKGRKLAPVDRSVLQGDNGWRMGQLRERPEKRKKHIPAPEAVVLNEGEGFRRGGGGLRPAPRHMIVLH